LSLRHRLAPIDRRAIARDAPPANGRGGKDHRRTRHRFRGAFRRNGPACGFPGREAAYVGIVERSMSASPSQKIVLGSRGSDLARNQTAMVESALQKAWPELEIVTEIIKARGDDRQAEPIDPRAGRKGLFTGEI